MIVRNKRRVVSVLRSHAISITQRDPDGKVIYSAGKLAQAIQAGLGASTQEKRDFIMRCFERDARNVVSVSVQAKPGGAKVRLLIQVRNLQVGVAGPLERALSNAVPVMLKDNLHFLFQHSHLEIQVRETPKPTEVTERMARAILDQPNYSR